MQLSIFGFAPKRQFRAFSATGLPISSSLPFSSRIFGYASPFYSLRSLVGSNGLGPSTSRLSGVCSNQLSYEPMFGGGNRIRTDDPLLAGQVLYQLSYTPVPDPPPFGENKCPPSGSISLLKTNKKEISSISVSTWSGIFGFSFPPIRLSLKGGDPAAPSDTATLLRLHPSHRYCLRQLPPCG